MKTPKDALIHMLAMIDNDIFACSFQSLGQYRTALIRHIGDMLKKIDTTEYNLAKNKEYIEETKRVVERAKTREADNSLTPNEIAFLKEFIAGQSVE